MIKIKIEKNDHKLNKITIKGHSNYEDLGKDIVCASVSSIVITSVNLALSVNDKSILYQDKDGYLAIEIVDEKIIYIFDNMITLLKELANDYPKNIKIKE